VYPPYSVLFSVNLDVLKTIHMVYLSTYTAVLSTKEVTKFFFIFWFIFDSVGTILYHARFFCLSGNKLYLLEMGQKLVFS